MTCTVYVALECDCEPHGVENDNLTCDADIGQCSCKPNVGGRRCDRCLAGYFHFPQCLQCTCKASGTLPDICDQESATCMCKKNVKGMYCDVCRPNTFHLEERNPVGCTPCFCFGATLTCMSSTYRRTQVLDMNGWGVTNVFGPILHKDGQMLELDIEEANIIDRNHPIYWVAPAPYLGNKVTSYGGKLTYVQSDSQGPVQAEVCMEGNNFTVVHTSPTQASPGQPHQVDILEEHFVHEETRAQVSHEQFMTMLANLQSLHIRASYSPIVTSVNISDVEMDTASQTGFGEMALNVEQCECPPNYKGSSCEECADGYYRAKTGPYLGVCVPCQCNGRADTCDPGTGECLNCRDNFGGPHCLECKQGYYMDDITLHCRSCFCPTEENNFASTCKVIEGIVTECVCLPGYSGRNCGMCAPGYFGHPSDFGGHCQPCECSGNIDTNDRGSCDLNTGECLKCINHSVGEHCEECKDWYWGDAVHRKDCQSCDCDRDGTDYCNPHTGQCECKPNIVGINCDQCADGTFGFDLGNGCSKCACAEGSYNDSCDPIEGQCECKPGVTGRACDECEQGYWNYTVAGCTKCQCEYEGAVTCDPITGHCMCLPGVTGPRCDRCLDRWVQEPDGSCKECDSCVHSLLDKVDMMGENTTEVCEDLKSVSVGVEAMRRLDMIEGNVTELRPQVDNMSSYQLIGDTLDQIEKELVKVTALKTKVKDKAERTAQEGEVIANDAMDMREDAENMDDMATEAAAIARDAIEFAQSVLDSITNTTVDREAVIAQGEAILEEIRNRSFSQNEADAVQELQYARELLTKAQELYNRSISLEGKLIDLDMRLADLDTCLVALTNDSRHELDDSQAAKDMNTPNWQLLNDTKDDLQAVEDILQDLKADIDMAGDMIDEALPFTRSASEAYMDVERESSRLDQALAKLGDHISERNNSNMELQPLVLNATEHALDLREQARNLDDLMHDTRESAEGALNATRVYQTIVDTINEAENTSAEAKMAAEEALDLSNDLISRANASKQTSDVWKEKADKVKAKVENDLRPHLEDDKQVVDQVRGLIQLCNDGIAGLNQSCHDAFTYREERMTGHRLHYADNLATEAKKRAIATEEKVMEILNNPSEEELKSKAKQIPMDIEEANRDIPQAVDQVNNTVAMLPEVKSLMDRLANSSAHTNLIVTDLADSIRSLKDTMQRAREEAGRIRVGVNFHLNTSLQIRNPPNLAESGSHTQLSMYFITEQPDGFLAYLGPDHFSDRPSSRADHSNGGPTVPSKLRGRQKRQVIETNRAHEQRTFKGDFMALEISEGRINFTFDLGGGPTSIQSNKVVNDGEWHEVAIERIGKIATVTVRTEEEKNDVTNGSVSGSFSVLNFNDATTKFFIGGVPMSANLPLTNLHYSGGIEDVWFDGIPIGLWNFVEGENNNHGILSRDVLKGPQSNGFRFNGMSAVVIDKGYFNPRSFSPVKLNFKTYTPNGLIFLMHGDQDYFSIEMVDGHVLYQYDLGSGAADIRSNGTFNDGQWHTLTATRRNQMGQLLIDDHRIDGNSPGDMRDLTVNDKIYIGGYFPGSHQFNHVTHENFDGCIKSLYLASILRDLNDNLFAMGVTEGCPNMDHIGLVSFDREETPNAFLAVDPENVNTNFEATLKIKTLEGYGLIMYLTNDDQSDALSLSMFEGRIMIKTHGSGHHDMLQTENTYNDGYWHYISITKTEDRFIQMDVDDTEMNMRKKMKGTKRLTTTEPLFLGGVPDNLQILDSNAGSTTPFDGCIGDVIVNGNLINFAESDGGALLGSCHMEDPKIEISVTKLPSHVLRPPPDESSQLDECALSFQPEETSPDEDATSTRFGLQPSSRLEYYDLPDDPATVSKFSLEFKTNENGGLMFYISDASQTDFIALYMDKGQLTYSFNCGSGPARIITTQQYNDNQWHKVAFWRNKSRGKLYVDGDVVAMGKSQGDMETVNVQPPYYVGGLPDENAREAQVNTNGVAHSFQGCLRDVQLNSRTFNITAKNVFTQPCIHNTELGSFFNASRRYISLRESFVVGFDLEISVEIKPRTLFGVILSVYSERGDYLVLQLEEGKLSFRVDNGKGEISTIYNPSNRTTMCNGHWHRIKALKAKNIVTLYVDGVFAHPPGYSAGSGSSTDTTDPLYIGGVPAEHKGIKTSEQYVGCIRNLKLGNELQNLELGKSDGDIKMIACPSN